MDINDLKPGDVLIFSGEKGSLVSDAIMLLTGAPVSHAAMVFTETQDIVEETPPSVAVHKAIERFQGRKIYVSRLDPGPGDLGPVLDAASRYVNDAEPYAMSNLYLVGLLLIYKRFTPNTLTKWVMIKILKRLAAVIIDAINMRKAPGKLPMVCSQFVYQCFEDAGGDYKLRLENPILESRAPAATDAPTEDTSTLDRVIRQVESMPSNAVAERMLRVAAASEPSQTEEELLAELCDALHAKEPASAEEPDDELAAAVGEFARAVHAAQPPGKAAPEAPGAPTPGEVVEALRHLGANQAYFVTPADLLNNCRNLERVGTIPA